MSIMSVEELQTALQSATQRCEVQRTALRTLYTELQEHTTKFDAIYIPPPRSLDLLHTISAALSNTSAVPSSAVRQQGRTQYSQNVGTPLPESLNKDSNGNHEEGNAAPRPRAGEAGLVPSASHRSSSQLSCPHSAAAAGAPQQQQQQQQQPRPSTSSRRSLSLTSSLNGLHGQSQAAPGTTQLRNNEPPRSASQRSASQRSVAHSSSYGGVIQPRPAQQEQRVHQPSSTHASSSAGIHPISPWILNSEASQAQEEEKPVSCVAELPQQQQQQQLPSVKTQDSLVESKKGEEREEEFVVPSIVKSSRDEAREAVAAEMKAYDDAQRQEEEEEHKAVQNNENQRAGTPLRKYTATTKNNNVSSTGSVNSSANPSATLHTANSNTSLSARPPSRHDGKSPSESTRPREPTCPNGAEEEARQFHTQPVIGTSSTPQERRMDSHPAIHSASTPAFYVAGTDEASEAAAQKARAAAAMQAVLNNNNITTVEPQHAEEEQEGEGRNSPVRSLVDRSNEKLRPIQPGRQSSHASQNVSVHQTPSQQGALLPVGIPSSYPNHPASAQSVRQQEEAENREPVAPNAAHVSSRSHSARSNGLNSTSNVSGGPRTTAAAATQGGSADLSTPRRKRPISPLRRPREPGLTHHHGSQILVPAANETGATPKNINTNSSAAAGVKQASPLPHSGTSPDVGPRAPALRSTPSSHASPNSQQLTVTKAQKDNSQPLSTRLVTQPPSAHALRTATPRRCVASGLDSGQIEKALYGGRVLQTGWPSHVVEDAPGVREFMEAEAERLQQREERDREARSPSLALLQQQQRHLAEQRSTSVAGNGRPRLSSGALIPVEDALQVTRAPPPSLTERQLLLERAQLANQLDKMFKEMVITMRRYDETGLEARYAQLNQRIARVQDDLKRVETEINVVQNLERKAQRRTISPF